MDAIKTGQLISQQRKALGLTQADLARKLHVSTQAVSKWERGLNFPDITLMEPLAQGLGLTVTQLLVGEEEMAAGEDVARDSLRFSLAQLLPRLRRWRLLFFAAAVILTLLLSWWGYTWVRDNTEWLPQWETVLLPQDMGKADLTLARLMGNQMVGMMEVLQADDLAGHQLQLELWEGQEMTQCWRVLGASGPYLPGMRRITLSFLLSVQGDQVTYSVMDGGAMVREATQTIPHSTSQGWNILTQPTELDRETGTVVAAMGLDIGNGIQTRAMQVGNFSTPDLFDGYAALLLRFTPEEAATAAPPQFLNNTTVKFP